jgi:hypothetical protein
MTATRGGWKSKPISLADGNHGSRRWYIRAHGLSAPSYVDLHRVITQEVVIVPLTVEASLFSEKIPQARQLDDVVGRQNRANQIGSLRGVNFIQVTLIFGLHHKLSDAVCTENLIRVDDAMESPKLAE